MTKPNIDIIVGGFRKDYPAIYKSIVVKAGLPLDVQLTEPSRKYIIKHNFDLKGGSVTVPENCILEFDGGSISNGTIIGNNTDYYGDESQWLFKYVSLAGTWTKGTFNIVNFGGGFEEDASVPFNRLISSMITMHPTSVNEEYHGIKECTGIVYVPSGIYTFSSFVDIDRANGLKIIGQDRESVIMRATNQSNFVIGNSSVGTQELEIRNMTFRECYAICISNKWNVVIEDCNFWNCPIGIAIRRTTGCYIKHCHFYACDYGITELNVADVTNSTTAYIQNCWFQHNNKGIEICGYPKSAFSDLHIENTILEYSYVFDIDFRKDINDYGQESNLYLSDIFFEGFSGDAGNVRVKNVNIFGKNLYWAPSEDEEKERFHRILVDTINEHTTITIDGLDKIDRVLPFNEDYTYCKLGISNEEFHVGTTRPRGLYKGQQFFDETLDRIIYWDGDTSNRKTGWVDSTGATV